MKKDPVVDPIIDQAATFCGGVAGLARLLGVADRTIYHWISGKREASPGVYQDLRAVLARRRIELDALIARLPLDPDTEAAMNDALIGGTGIMRDGKRIDPDDFWQRPDAED